MKLLAHGESDVGRVRPQNEDTIIVDSELGLFLVCDGMGGHAAGEVASSTASKAVHRYIASKKKFLRSFKGTKQACKEVEEILRTAIQKASEEVFELASTQLGMHGMGTTCVALLTLGEKGFMGHVGDSRIYLSRDEHVWQLSQDHTFYHDAVTTGRMTEFEASESPWAGALTRCVGMQQSVTVDTLVFDIVEGDTLLLCSDGLSSYVHEHSEIMPLLSDGEVEELPRKLIHLANERGGADNISAIVVRAVGDLPPRARDSTRRAEMKDALAMFRHITLFADLSDQEILRLFSKFRAVDEEAGNWIIREGDDAESMYIIVEGEVDVVSGEKLVAHLAEGSHFGEMGLLNQRPRSASVIAKTTVRMLVLEREAFHHVLLEDALLAAKLLYKLAQTLSLRLDVSLHSGEPGEIASPFRPRK